MASLGLKRFVKNPNTVKIRSLIRDEIMQVEEVTAAEVTSVNYDRAKSGRPPSYLPARLEKLHTGRR